LPDAFGLEDDFDEFAGGAFAAVGFGDVVGGAADFRRGVMNCDSQADALHDSQIGEVVAEEGDFGFFGAGLSQDVFVGGDLVALLFVDEFDVEFLAAPAEGWAGSAGDDAGAQAGGNG
jgi:hypothetical protein